MQQLPIEEFGKQLLDTKDLDPVYVALEELDLDTRARWCTAYWLYYHCGIACMATDSDFWKVIWDNLEGRRGMERRHFRGGLAREAVRQMENNFPDPAGFPASIAETRPLTFRTLTKAVQKHYGFGVWISFKISDVMERCLKYPVDGSDCIDTWYRDPLLASDMLCEEKGWNAETPKVKACGYLIQLFGDRIAPPDGRRRFNAQEAETILCKWKSHRHKHYYIGKDTIDVYEALKNVFTPSAIKMKRALKPLKRQFERRLW